METKKVIFLDIDGVLNSEKWYKQQYEKYRDAEDRLPKGSWELTHINPDITNLIAEIVKQTGAEIVLTSSWRGQKERNKALFKHFGLELADETPRGMRVSLGEETLYTFRGLEVNYYLEKHPEICNYVIFDDDSDMLYYQRNHFIHVSSKTGLTRRDAKRAIMILNSDNTTL